MLLAGASPPSLPLDPLKSLHLLPKNASLGKPEKIKLHSLPFLRYPVLLDEGEIGYLIYDERGKLEEFSLPNLEKIARIKEFPRFPFFLNSHATAGAIFLALLHFKGNEPEKAFIASINVFIEKCLCDQPGKPLTYDIKKGLEDFAKYKGKRLELEEVYKFGKGDDALLFYKREIDSGRAVVVSFLYDKEGRKPERARERRESDSFLGIGYLPLGKQSFLILYDGRGFLARSYSANCSNIIVLGARER